MQIDALAHHMGMIHTIAEWHRAEWGHLPPCDTVTFWAECLRVSANDDCIPITFVATDAGEPLGSVTLVTHNMETHKQWTPWLAALYVHPAHRDRGVASALVRHAMQAAQVMGIPRLYLYTNTARGLYEWLGWRLIEETNYEGARVAVMSVSVAFK
jgi:GNAT superfamily N-acetyltransferase